MSRYFAARDQRETLARVAAMLARRSANVFRLDDAARLCSISRSLSRIAERQCNEDVGETLDKREARLEAEARDLAALYGLRVYFHGDPGGAALYLIDPDKGPASEDYSNYSSRGVAAY